MYKYPYILYIYNYIERYIIYLHSIYDSIALKFTLQLLLKLFSRMGRAVMARQNISAFQCSEMREYEKTHL